MSWMQKLYETYEQCHGNEPLASNPLMPISHTMKQAHIEISIDQDGNFKKAKVIKKEETLIPATEESAGRSGSKVAPHPLCDKIHYCASDYPVFGGKKLACFGNYEKLLNNWCQSEYRHSKAEAVLKYVRKKRVLKDLVQEKILFLDDTGKLLTGWDGENSPDIFKMLTAHPNTKEKDQGDAFIRWQVLIDGNLCPEVWKDNSLQDAWESYDATLKELKGLCFVTGEDVALTANHPKRIRHSGDGAKLISSNDSSGFTFRGRFTDNKAQQASGVGYEVTQKAHSVLRWLIARQGYRNGDQSIVAWAVSGKSLPDPFENSSSLFLNSEEFSEKEAEPEQDNVGDVGQDFGLRLRKMIAGYKAELNAKEDIVVMGLDSASPGRMAVIFYRELQCSEFLERIQGWHEKYAWLQNYGKKLKFVGAPSPRDIAEATYGHRLDDKLRKSTVERLLPCIIDSQRFPRDLVQSAVRRTCNRQALEPWEWEKNLGIACALFKGLFTERKYQMTLETERDTRDYLYGRLLAIADSIENYALSRAGEKRDTTAAKLMQRFADRPFSTWRNIELALPPYKARLRSSEKTAGFLWRREQLLDEVVSSFQEGDFSSEKDRPLSGEFLLGYHCQRQSLYSSKTDDSGNSATDGDTTDSLN